jgi:hypothetical protein
MSLLLLRLPGFFYGGKAWALAALILTFPFSRTWQPNHFLPFAHCYTWLLFSEAATSAVAAVMAVVVGMSTSIPQCRDAHGDGRDHHTD